MFTMYSTKEVSLDAIENLYKDKGNDFSNDCKLIQQAISESDFCITAWDGELFIGIIRSSGDVNIIQFITEFFVHDDYQAHGVATGLINEYFEAAKDVKEFYMFGDMTGGHSYLINWLEHKGFEHKVNQDNLQLFHKKQYSTTKGQTGD